MDKKLPKVFANKIDKSFDNIQGVFSTSNNSSFDHYERSSSESIETKINRIFSGKDFVYKSDVEITTDAGVSRKVLIGKTNTALLTMDNDIIDIHRIRDIRKI